MSLFANHLNQPQKKLLLQSEHSDDQLLLGRKKQISFHGSPINLILKNIKGKLSDRESPLTSFTYELRFDFPSIFDTQRLTQLWKEINKTIKRHNWKQIRILMLAFDGKYRGTPQDFEHVASLFSKSFWDLTTLSLRDLQEGTDAKLGLCLISEIGRNLLKIKDLQIHFRSESDVKECIKLLAAETFESLVELKHFHLEFGASRTLTSHEIDLLCEGINKKAPRLVSLILDFSSCRNFNDECMRILGLKLCSKLSHLNHLELAVSMNEVTDQGVIDLSNFLTSPDLQKLHTLNIDFADCPQVTMEGFVYFAEKIAENLKNLQKLSFSFGIQPDAEDYESSEDFEVGFEKEIAYRSQIEEKLNEIFHFIPPNSLDLDSEVVWG